MFCDVHAFAYKYGSCKCIYFLYEGWLSSDTVCALSLPDISTGRVRMRLSSDKLFRHKTLQHSVFSMLASNVMSKSRYFTIFWCILSSALDKRRQTGTWRLSFRPVGAASTPKSWSMSSTYFLKDTINQHQLMRRKCGSLAFLWALKRERDGRSPPAAVTAPL